MSDHNAEQTVEVSISAVVTRADGTVEDLGVLTSDVVPANPSLVERIRKAVN